MNGAFAQAKKSMKTPIQTPIRQWVHHSMLGATFVLAHVAHAGVIPGTGNVPTATQLGTTDAVGFQMAESGPGHVLVVPYFTAQGGQMSVLHLVNTDLSNGKAVKLRYRGAGNADTLLDMVVLLSPGDVWTGAVNAGSDGKAQIVTADNSCTWPPIPTTGQSFSTARLNPQWTAAEQANNTREGYIEAIVMADIPSRAVYGFKGSEKSMLFTAINHVAGMPPCTTSVIDAALLNDTSVEAVAASRGFATPTGGLMGSWYIIDVPGTTTFSGSATAFTAVNSNGQAARGNYVLFPQSSEEVVQPERFTADPLLVSAGLAGRSKTVDGVISDLTTTPVLQARFSDLPDLSTPYYLPASATNARRTAGDLTQTLAVKSVKNQYATESSISAKTDWVFSMPTMRYSVAFDYAASGTTPPTVYSLISPRDSNEQYFSGRDADFLNGNVEAGIFAKRLLVTMPEYWMTFWDRESTGNVAGLCIGLCPPPARHMPGMVSVLSFADAGNSALSSSVARRSQMQGVFNNGWKNASTLVPGTNLGLPLLGASFIKLTNPAAQPGVSGNYGISWPHGYTR